MPELSCSVSNTLFATLHHLQLIIIDEISMVGSSMINRINTRLQQIFKSQSPFGNIPTIVFGDFNQLRPVKDSYIFSPKINNKSLSALASKILWSNFKYYELDEIMRQRDDLNFARALNNLANGELNIEDIELFKKQQKKDPSECKGIRLMRTNREVDTYNEDRIKSVAGENCHSQAIDTFNGDAKEETVEYYLNEYENRERSMTNGLAKSIWLKIGIRYMVVVNISVVDGIVNGSTGVLRQIDYINQRPIRIWIEFDEKNCGRRIRSEKSNLFRLSKVRE